MQTRRSGREGGEDGRTGGGGERREQAGVEESEIATEQGQDKDGKEKGEWKRERDGESGRTRWRDEGGGVKKMEEVGAHIEAFPM